LANAALGAFIIPAVALVPYAAIGQSGVVISQLRGTLSGPDWLTYNAHNIWYLLTLGQGNWRFNAPLIHADSDPLLGMVTPRTLGYVMVIMWSAMVLYVAWSQCVNSQAHQATAHEQRMLARLSVQLRHLIRPAPLELHSAHGAGWMLSAILVYLGVFLFPTRIHERYAFGALIMAAGWFAISSMLRNRRYLWRDMALFVMISLLHLLNLVWAAPFSPGLSFFAGNVTVGIVISTGFIALAVWGCVLLFEDR